MIALGGQLTEKPSTEVASTQKAENSRTVANTISRETHGEDSSTVTQTVSNEIGGDAAGRFEAQVTYPRRRMGGVFVHYGKKKGGQYFCSVPLAHLHDRDTLDQRLGETRRVGF